MTNRIAARQLRVLERCDKANAVKRIVLSIATTSGQVMATFVGDLTIKHLFGTNTLPTPFNFNAIESRDIKSHAEEVLSEIKRRNPEYQVEWHIDFFLGFKAFSGEVAHS